MVPKTHNFQNDRAEVALLGEDAGVFADGSFIFAQRLLPRFRKMEKAQSGCPRACDWTHQT